MQAETDVPCDVFQKCPCSSSVEGAEARCSMRPELRTRKLDVRIGVSSWVSRNADCCPIEVLCER